MGLLYTLFFYPRKGIVVLRGSGMNIEFACSNCGANLKVLKAFAGKTIMCPKCAKKTVVPASGSGHIAKSASPAASPILSPIPIQTPIIPKPSTPAAELKGQAVEGAYISFACTACSSMLKVLKSFAGKSIQCPKCAKKTQVPGGVPKESSAPQAPAPVSPCLAKEELAASMLPAATPPGSPAADEALLKRLGEQEQKTETLMRQMQEMGEELKALRMTFCRFEEKIQEASQARM